MVYQSLKDDCGKACVRNVLCMLFKDEYYATQLLVSPCNDFYSIREELERFDIKYVSYEVKDISMISKERLPGIAQINNGGKTHFVVVESILHNKVVIRDPEFGRFSLKMEEFKEVFLGRIILKDKVGKRQDVMKGTMLRLSDNIAYIFCFISECIAFAGMVIFSGMEDSFIYSLFASIILFVLILLQNYLNVSIQHRLERNLLIPYMRVSQSSSDFATLNTIMHLKTGRRSKSVSYGVVLFAITLLLLLNSYYLAFLTVISLVFTLVRLPLIDEKNKINRYCSLKENIFLNKIKSEEDVALDALKKAKMRSYRYLLMIVASWVMEIAILLIFIMMELSALDRFNMNLIVYYLGLMVTFSFTTRNLFLTALDNREEICSINRLSYPLSVFLLKEKLNLKYNSKNKGD